MIGVQDKGTKAAALNFLGYSTVFLFLSLIHI